MPSVFDDRPPQNDDEARLYIHENFGILAYYINHPEIGRILLDAGYNRWSEDRLKTALMGTQWWQTHSDAQRTYEDLEKTDPATLSRMINEKQAVLYDLMLSLGVQHPDIGQLTRDALRFGWSDNQVTDMLVGLANLQTTRNPGIIQTLYHRSKDAAASYFLQVSDQTAFDLAKKVAKGELDEEAMIGQYREWAKSRTPHLAKVIDQGVSLQEYFDPHRNEIARLLEVAPSSIDFINNRDWRKVITTYDPDAKENRAMTIYETAELARGTKQWKGTDNARALGANMAVTLAQVFGEM